MALNPVSVVGLGAMGGALAGAFLRAGHPTTVWNRTPGAAGWLDAQGARRADTLAEAVGASPLVVLCVVHNDVVHRLLEPVAGELAGRTVVNLTNGTPGQARVLARRVDDHRAHYLDGGIMAVPPMIGTPGALVFYSGRRDGFDVHRPTLAALGTARYLGPDPGQAAVWDLALLAGMYGMFAGFLHATGLARANGATAVELVAPLREWLTAMMASLPGAAERIDSARYGPSAERPVGSPLAMQAAAFDNLIDAARESGVKPDLLVPLGRLMTEAVAAGHGDHDLAAVADGLTA